ncbi:restriction endonuclease [Bacillus safensis]
MLILLVLVISNFHGAFHQIKPDEAIVVTTKGYTREAVNFADDENIKLTV